jgi:hypothetical protein
VAEGRAGGQLHRRGAGQLSEEADPHLPPHLGNAVRRNGREIATQKWKVLPFAFDCDELDWNPRARGYLTEVWAATRSQAKYLAYRKLEECCVDASAMCFFKVRRA